MDIRYLWIDCLCIIQGDEKDWQTEANMMQSVYANALINVAASDAEHENGNNHLYAPKDKPMFNPLDVEFGIDEEEYQVFLDAWPIISQDANLNNGLWFFKRDF